MLRLVALLGCACLTAACVNGPVHPTNPVSNRPQDQGRSSPPRLPGRIYADQACANCHAVAAGQTRSPDPKAPTFEAIANMPGMTTIALNVWLHASPHRNMPNIRVDPDQLDILSEYLFSLKK